jgi:hypothetical protein
MIFEGFFSIIAWILLILAYESTNQFVFFKSGFCLFACTDDKYTCIDQYCDCIGSNVTA